MSYSIRLIGAIIVSCHIIVAVTTLPPPTCLNENGESVDSWVSLSTDEDYTYYWHNQTLGFMKSPYRTNQTMEGGIMRTVNQLYEPQLDMSNVAYALYNDDPPGPDTASSSYAHSKGFILLNNESGVWLIHSKPNWPNARADNASGFPDTTYAQSLMCITFNTSSFEKIARHQMVNHPYVYDSFMSANLVEDLPLFNEWINENGKSELLNLTSLVTSKGGVTYTQFAKAKAWGRDLYDDLVAPGLGEALNVETWRNGAGGRMSSNCQDYSDDAWMQQPLEYDIFQVEEVTMPDGQSWLGTKDHSKWAASVSGSTICVADINRMCSQENRGGGAVCVQSNATAMMDPASPTDGPTAAAYANVAGLWTSFNQSVTAVEECWEYDPCAGTSTQCYWCPSSAPTLPPTHAPTLERVPSISATPTVWQEKTLAVGDVAIVLYNTDNPDSFSLVALKDVVAGIELLVTDNGWYESTGSFRTGEGVLGFRVTSSIPAGTTWYYEKDTGMSNAYGTWEVVSGSFALSSSGDSIIVYLQDEDTSDVSFVYGLSTIPWETDLTATLTSSTSNLPSALSTGVGMKNASIYFDDSNDNGAYQGVTEGFQDELLNAVAASASWTTSDSSRYPPQTTLNSSFTVFSPSTAPSPQPSEDPDSHSGSDNDDGSALNTISIVLLVTMMVVTFLCLCMYAIRKRSFENKTFRPNLNATSVGSSVDGKVLLLDRSEQRASEIDEAMRMASVDI